MNYDREARRLLRSGYREAANRVAIAGVENRPKGIRSYEGRMEEERMAEAADRFDRMSRYRALTGRGEAGKSGDSTAAAPDSQPATQAAKPAAKPTTKPDFKGSASDYAVRIGAAAEARDKTDAEGKATLNARSDELLAKAEKEYGRKQLFDTASSSTAALNKAVAESSARSSALPAPKTGGTGKAPFADDLAEIARIRAGAAETLKQSADRKAAKDAALRQSQIDALDAGVAHTAAEDEKMASAEYRGKYSKEDRDKARADAAASIKAAPLQQATASGARVTWNPAPRGSDPKDASRWVKELVDKDRADFAARQSRIQSAKDSVKIPEWQEGTAIGAVNRSLKRYAANWTR